MDLRLSAGPSGPDACELEQDRWAAIVVSAITSIALAHVLYYAAIQRIGTTIPMLVVLAQPFLVFGLSSAFFHERLNGLKCSAASSC